MPAARTTRSSASASSPNPRTPAAAANLRRDELELITPPSAEQKTSPPSAPKSISVRGRKRGAGLEARSGSPSEERGASNKRRRLTVLGTNAGAQAEAKAKEEEEKEEEELADAASSCGSHARHKEGSDSEGECDGDEGVKGARKDKKKENKKNKKKGREEGKSKTQDSSAPKKQTKRKTKEEKEAEAMPLAARTMGLNMFVGAHVSMAKGLENSVTNAVHIGGNAFALFLKSQRKWENKALQDENRDLFRRACMEHKYDAASHVLPHGSYLVNLAQEEPSKAKQSYDAFLDDLKRCEALGITLYNFHPGATGQSTPAQAITRIANSLNKALSATSTVIPVLENMAGSGTVIGGTFESLGSVIRQIKPEHKHRIGVCIDTCHSFAAGYDLRTPKSFAAVLEQFDKTVGMRYLKALHLNDSKTPHSSHRDLHANIGTGFLGLRAFHNVMNEPRFQNLPLILETPCEKPDPSDATGKKTIEDKRVWAREIKLLESLIGMDVESEEFKKMEKLLSEEGRTDREERQAAFDKKLSGEKKKLAKKEKGQGALSWGKRD